MEVTRAKRVISNKDNAEPQIHFEFYTALPTMQVTVSTPSVKTEQPVGQIKKIMTEESVTKPSQKIISEKAPTAFPIANAKELEKDFAKEMAGVKLKKRHQNASSKRISSLKKGDI